MDKSWERRKYVRVTDKLQITYEVVSHKKIDDYVTKDISEGGVRFLAHEFIPKDSHLKISFTFKTYINYHAFVKVVWINEAKGTRDYEIGVEFINMPFEAQQYLIEHIKECITCATKQST